MDSKSAVLSIIAIKPHALNDLVSRLPYAASTIYEAVRILKNEGLVKVEDGLVIIGEGYHAKKTADIHVLALSHGIDPEFLLKESTLTIWKELEEERRFKEIQNLTGYSLVTVKLVISYLEKKGLVIYRKRKPVIVVKKDDHPINKELKLLLHEKEDTEAYHYPGTVPFDESFLTPEELERTLFDKIEEGISVKDTGFLVRDDNGTVSILESTEKIPTSEEVFLLKLLTTEGVEDLCIKVLKTGKIDLEVLLDLSIEKGMTSIVGCYLDILKDLDEEIVSDEIIEKFLKSPSGKKERTFLKQEKSFGKSGWESKYEKKWIIDLYLDLDAIRHGVRSA